MNYYRFFVANYKIILFAIALTFFSAFGQTFILALYIPEIIHEFDITQKLYSSLYAGATLMSGITIIFAGKIIDRTSVKKFTLWVIAGLIAANLMAGLAQNLVMIFLAIFMLRFFGQGMFTHTAATSMGRFFSFSRGKALSLTHLGFPLAESVFPIAVVSIILVYGWRETFFLSAAFIALALFPLVIFLLRGFDRKNIIEDDENDKNRPATGPDQDRFWSQKQLIRTIKFYLLAPSVFIVGFVQTSLFFYQSFIAEYKGWSREWMALSITAYAVASLLSSIATGPLADKFSAKAVFPFVQIPLSIGLLLLSSFTHPAIAMVMWFFVGITGGSSPTAANAVYAELFGIKSLGGIRSIFTFVMVVSTAAGPVVYSFLLDKGFNYDHIHLFTVGVVIINVLFVYFGFKNQKIL